VSGAVNIAEQAENRESGNGPMNGGYIKRWSLSEARNEGCGAGKEFYKFLKR